MDYTQVVRLPQYFRNLQRLSEIARIFVKHGFGDLVARINLFSYLETGFRVLHTHFGPTPPREHVEFTTRLRLAFEELGPTFIKFGQVIATRPDVFGVALAEEFRRLQDNALPFPANLARAIIAEEFGKSVELCFLEFDDTPIAAGSIAQIHRAKLRDGSAAAVKVQRPNLERLMDADLDILRGIATLVEEHVPELRGYSPRRLVEEFARTLKSERDFRREITNIKKFRSLFSDCRGLVIPQIHDALCSRRVLTEQFVEGWKVDSPDALEVVRASGRGAELAAVLNDVLLRSIFDYRFFHADPHPGNVLVTPNANIALLDFGSMGRLDDQRLHQVIGFLVALFSRRPEKMVKLLRESGMLPDRAEDLELRVQISELLDLYLDVPLGELSLGALLGDVFDLIRRHDMRTPADLFLVAKSLTTIEHIGRTLDPDFNPGTMIFPFIRSRYIEHLRDPRRYIASGLETADGYRRLAMEFPNEARRMLKHLARGSFTVSTHFRDFEAATLHQNRMANRIIIAFIAPLLLVCGLLLNLFGRAELDISASYALLGWGALLIVILWRAVRKSGGLS